MAGTTEKKCFPVSGIKLVQIFFLSECGKKYIPITANSKAPLQWCCSIGLRTHLEVATTHYNCSADSHPRLCRAAAACTRAELDGVHAATRGFII